MALSFGQALLRRKRLDQMVERGKLPSHWDRHLGTFGTTAIALALSLAFVLHLILPGFFAAELLRTNESNSSSGHTTLTSAKSNVPLWPPLLVVLLLFSTLLLLAGQQLSAASRRVCSNSPAYQLAFGLLGQGPAFWLGWSQLLDQILVLALLAHSFSAHIDFLFRPDSRIPPVENDQLKVDWIALALPFVGAVILLFNLRVLLTMTVVFLLSALFTTASTGTVALLHGTIGIGTNVVQNMQNGQEANDAIVDFGTFPSILANGRWLLLAFVPLESITFLSEECTRPSRTIPPLLPRMAKAQCLLLLGAMLAFFPLLISASSSHSLLWPKSLLLPLPALFHANRLFSARYLMSVGSICALLAAILCLFLPATRLLVLLANDNVLWPKCLGRVAKGGQARPALLAICLLAILAILLPKQWLFHPLPLNLTLRMNCQALLVFLAHFKPSSTGPSPQEYGRIGRNEGEEGEEDSEWSDEEEQNCAGGIINRAEGEQMTALARQGEEVPLTVGGQINNLYSASCSSSTILTHNCLNSPCANGQTGPNPLTSYQTNLHLFEPASGGVAEARRESGSRAAASLDDHQAYTRAKLALTGCTMLALVCAFSVRAILETHEYVPMLAVFSLLLSVPLALWTGVWLGRSPLDSAKSTWLPLGSMLSSFLLIQMALLLSTLSEWAAVMAWGCLGMLLHFLSMLLLKRR